MATIRISLPDYLQEFVDGEIAGRGPLTRGEFVEQLVLNAYLEKHQEELEPLLLKGLQGPFAPMTKQDWENIRRRVRQRMGNEKKRKRKGA